MDFPSQRRHGLPSIQIDDRRPAAAANYGLPLSRAINIPHPPRGNPAPPPLPPPRDPFNGPSFADQQPMPSKSYYDDSRQNASSMSSFGSSLYGSMENGGGLPPLQRPESRSPYTDEGYASINSIRLPSLFNNDFGRLHSQYNLNSANEYSSSIKDKLDSHIPTRPKASHSFSRPSHSDFQPTRPSLNTTLPPLVNHSSLPSYPSRTNTLDSPPTDTYSSSAISPNSSTHPFSFSNHSDHDRSPPQYHRMSTSSRNGYDSLMDEHDMQRMNLFDRDRVGSKRRATSPPEIEHPLPPAPHQVEMVRRRELHRGSPAPRLSTIPQVPMAHSGPAVSMIGTYDRVSPGSAPSGPVMVMNNESIAPPHLASGGSPMNISPRGSVSRAPHQRNSSMASPRRINELKGDGPRVPTFWVCECCAKKPRKFQTIEELHAHEAEKQYECQYCHNRFKNKNEAERHQNSLHVRRHSWSCKALDNFNKAFHENLASNGTRDICGYCGKDFERRGFFKADGVSREVGEQDREERIHHLQTAHKFRECNSSKKFFRADHFRQHLKHSHSGTSGKWTNQLENACMRDEPPLR
ncbi:hypothetical protein Cpir12675_006070 [Ceratocystis pirilliformis]|uniref:C2H2-type domain-containing protein n=1 Tax=Ceratocystis pirilliformis TaxID=259994 RepID=A0ABR3YLI2_9PEZI